MAGGGQGVAEGGKDEDEEDAADKAEACKMEMVPLPVASLASRRKPHHHGFLPELIAKISEFGSMIIN